MQKIKVNDIDNCAQLELTLAELVSMRNKTDAEAQKHIEYATELTKKIIEHLLTVKEENQ